ncbi:MAG: bifunctional phosphoglucose/phosphomannose isomerase [Candidatus Marinimicrobia bacterium]|nr:bifunctional phosphoglucose/phosphomannose isomerase [Candidatus Neomarinimicrobiota bacterium]
MTKFIDPQGMKDAVYNFADDINKASKIGKKIILNKKYNNIHNIIVVGMGGSAIGGDINKMLLKNDLSIPLIVSRNYFIPKWANKHSLVVVSSYSGGTEETLSAFKDALSKECQIYGITTGGILSKELSSNDLDFILIPSGLQPRAALAYSFVPMLYLFLHLGLIKIDLNNNLMNSIKLLKSVRDDYMLNDQKNPTWVLSNKIFNTIPILYGETDNTSVIALRWSNQLSENSKMLAFCNEIPEFNHNEIVGWENNPNLIEKFSIIWLSDESDQERISIRQKISEKILETMVKNQFKISLHGSSRFDRLLHLMHFGDWVSLWCAYLHGTDPSPVDKISRLKKELTNL